MRLSADDIIYEDNHLLVLNKAPGLLSQEDRTGDEDILSLAKAMIKERDHKPGNVYLGLVHRLDRNTGGVMCLAKTSKAASRLSAQIRAHNWQKSYLALTPLGPGEKPGGPFVRWLDRLKKDGSLNQSRRDAEGKKAELCQRVLAVSPAAGPGGADIALREVLLLSGRSHQIRVQAAARGLPLLGDSKYGGARVQGESPYFLGLWAFGLELSHPVKNKRMKFYAKPPEEGAWASFAAAVDQACAESEAEA